jgi:glycosyltransferase 2 family protein
VLLRHHRGAGFMAASILADRVINVATTAAVSLLAVAVTYALRGAWPFPPAVAHAVIAIALLVIVAAFAAASDRATALAVRLLHAGARAFPKLTRVPRWIDAAAQVHVAMSAMLTGRGTLLPAIVLAAGTVLARVGTVFFLFIAIGAPQPFALTAMLAPIITLIALLPISLFGLGVKDSAFVFFFGSAGVPASLALAVSLTSYGVVIAASLLLGLIASVVGPPLPTRSALGTAPERNSP